MLKDDVDFFMETIKKISQNKINKFISLAQIVDYNEETGLSSARLLYEKTTIKNVYSSGIGLGNNKGIISGYASGDVVVLVNIKNTYYIIGSLFNVFFADKDNIIVPKKDEITFQNKSGYKISLFDDNITMTNNKGDVITLNDNGLYLNTNKFPEGNGSVGQVLKTDGAGTLYWGSDNT